MSRPAAKRPRRPRMVRISVGLDEHTNTELRTRARAHGVSKAAFIRNAIVGARPGGGRGETAHAADTWWDTLSPDRRAGIHQWITSARGRDPLLDPAQIDIFEALLEQEAADDAA